ncbi:MAG: hypothetical protein ILO68_01955, partial [Clostridia bacterium]|nr:hypothetical protein [Clostridia bacterium]
MKKDNRASFPIRDRFRYWFDNRMTKGSLGLIRVLIVVSVLFAVLVAGLIILFGFNEEGETASVFWDGIATVINAWMPSYEDGSPGYLVLMSLIAVAGVLFTSVLIGIITSAIEEKIASLKRGNSPVLEKNHLVVLGFYPGEYALLQHLILAAAGKPACVVLADDLEREDMEQGIRDNLEVPKNFRIICRTADITDPAALEKCSLETSRGVIVSPTDELRTLKTILAVSSLLESKDRRDIGISAIIPREEHRFPSSLTEANHIHTLQTNRILAKLIAHSCTQTGLSEVFREVFNFEGCEFYFASLPDLEGRTFGHLMARMKGATPAAVLRDGRLRMNPPADFELRSDDRILVFSETAGDVSLSDAGAADATPLSVPTEGAGNGERTSALIIGSNETLPLILRELPENVSSVCLAGLGPDEDTAGVREAAAGRGLSLKFGEEDPETADGLAALAETAEHIIVLNDHEKDPDEADMDVLLLLLHLRDIRNEKKLRYNVTVELQKEKNQKLAGRGDRTDYLVASSMSSLILAQLAESPDLIGVFRELLSNDGSEI